MGKHLNGFCKPCQRTIEGSNWNRHLDSKGHLARSKGKIVKKNIVLNTVQAPKRGRPKEYKLQPLDTNEMLAHLRARGMELYFW